MLDVKRLRVLREVARQGSFSAAAEALSYTQSAISQQIAVLERETGTTLVERGTRGIRAAAAEADVSSATLSRVENGHMPDLVTFAKICRWLEVDPREFLGVSADESAPAAPETVAHFRKKKTVSEETAVALGELILAAQRAMQARQELFRR